MKHGASFSRLSLLLSTPISTRWSIEIWSQRTFSLTRTIISSSLTLAWPIQLKIVSLSEQPVVHLIMRHRRSFLANHTAARKSTFGHAESSFMRWSVEVYHLTTNSWLFFLWRSNRVTTGCQSKSRPTAKIWSDACSRPTQWKESNWTRLSSTDGTCKTCHCICKTCQIRRLKTRTSSTKTSSEVSWL